VWCFLGNQKPIRPNFIKNTSRGKREPGVDFQLNGISKNKTERFRERAHRGGTKQEEKREKKIDAQNGQKKTIARAGGAGEVRTGYRGDQKLQIKPRSQKTGPEEGGGGRERQDLINKKRKKKRKKI